MTGWRFAFTRLREDEWEVIQTLTPHIHEQRLAAIPVILANARQLGTEMVTPPLLAIADLVLSHYRSSADLEQGNYYASRCRSPL